ncbi:MAG: phosphatidylglycerol lysyltransferase [Blastococcus sp.]|nr:phosphatidylglycerol lysyltransferase [Blastococcus sp.]
MNAVWPVRVARLLRRTPVTAALVLLLIAAAVGSGSGRHRVPFARVDGLGAGIGHPLWTLLSSAIWTTGPLAGTGAVAGALLLALAERRLGGRVIALVFGIGQVAGTAVALAGIDALSSTRNEWVAELSRMAVTGPWPGLLAVLGFTSSRLPALWRRRVRVMVPIVLTVSVLYVGTTNDVVQLVAWLIGLAAGALWRVPGAGSLPGHITRREVRSLVALVVAVTALGPLVAALSASPDGPWAVVSHLFVSVRPDHSLLRAVCQAGGDPTDCRVLRARARLTGHGPALLSLLPVLLQVVLAEGLRRGRRAAWVAAVALATTLTVVGAGIVATVTFTPADELSMLAAHPGTLSAMSILAPVLAPGSVLVLLLATGAFFGVQAAAGASRRWLFAAGSGLAALAALYVTIGSLLSRQWTGAPSPVALLEDLPWRMLPPGYLGEVLAPLVPRDGATRLLADWTGVAAWAVLLVTAVRFVRPAVPGGDAARARTMVERYGDGALSFMTTWTGNRYWFLPDGPAMVAYRVVGGVAVTTGDPVGRPDLRGAAVRGFTRFCDRHGWTPCWYSVTDAVVRELDDDGSLPLQIAAETWLPLGELSFSGRRWQDVRTAMNRAAREGVTEQWFTWSRAQLGLRAQIARLSEEWLAAKGLPEMGFTLGGLDELADDAVRCLAAVGPEGELRGLTSWLPAMRGGRPVGWTLDVMRRAGSASPGVMEFLIARAMLTFQDEGAEWVSLSGAPLALPPGAGDRGRLDRLLELAGRAMEPVYGFRSLLAFKAKFQPHYRPLWLVYPSAADLPRIARAVSGAYLPRVSPGQAVRLTRALVRGRRSRPASRPVPPRAAGFLIP